MKSWYRSWFDSPYYHLLYRHRDGQEASAFIDQIIKYFQPEPNAHFLDLACGQGRHSIQINQKGFPTSGVDLSEQNISKARQFESDDLTFHVHDMRLPFRKNAFDFALNLFTSFGYFTTTDENADVLRALHYNLKPKGKLLIDFLNITEVEKGLIHAEKLVVDDVEFEIKRKIDKGFITKQIDVRDGEERHVFHECVSALTKQDFVGLLGSTGFEILDIFGNYNLAQFDQNASPRLIFIARKIQ